MWSFKFCWEVVETCLCDITNSEYILMITWRRLWLFIQNVVEAQQGRIKHATWKELLFTVHQQRLRCYLLLPHPHFSPALYRFKYVQSNNAWGIINPRAPIGSNWHLLEGLYDSLINTEEREQMAAELGGGLIGKQSAGAMHTGGNQHLIISEVFATL